MAETKPADAGTLGQRQAAAAPVGSAPPVVQPSAPPAAPAKANASPAKEEAPKSKGYVVTGAAVVLPTEGGSERYLYRGAPVGEGYTKDGIKHAVSLGLIAKAK